MCLRRDFSRIARPIASIIVLWQEQYPIIPDEITNSLD